MTRPSFHPRLISSIGIVDAELVLARDGLEFALKPEASTLSELQEFLHRLDGRQSLEQILAGLSADARARFSAVVEELDELFMLDDAAPAPALSDGARVFDEIVASFQPDWTTMTESNVLWRRLRETNSCPPNVVHGLLLETHSLWFQGIAVDLSVAHSSSALARRTLRAFAASLQVDERLLLDLLEAAGLSAQDFADLRPLPTTLTFANALSYWSRAHPLALMAALGTLLHALPTSSEYLRVLEQQGLLLDPKLGTAARGASELQHARAGLGRRLMAEVDHVDAEAASRLAIDVRVFHEMLESFFTAIWNHYSVSSRLARRLSDI